jgi:SpoVK/Ycf46/Vps4 family AAA+-type ATPase
MTPAGLFFVAKKILTDRLIDLGNSNSQRVIEGIKLFWTRKRKFEERGILFKRGILMWGPPGSGKTATLALLVEDLIRQGGIVLLVQYPGAAVQALRQLRKIEPERPLIVVLEDVEEIIGSHGEHDLLALLDGEHQTDNVVNIATTNYPEMLGARIINRPSRFDEVVKIGMPSESMREQYLVHILGQDGAGVPIGEWVEETAGMSIAHLKELVVAVCCLEQPYDEVIARLKTMKSAPRSTMYEEKLGFLGGNNGSKLQSGGASQAPGGRR